MPKILLTSDENAWRITLNAPPLNILDLEMLGELQAALADVRDDRSLLIVDAAGEKAFSAGVSVPDHTGDRIAPMLASFHDCFRRLKRLQLVTIAEVRGVALGGGCELALACDFVLASDRARFGLPEIQLGVFPPVAAYQLSRQTAPRKGLELMLTGDPIDAPAAERLGLVNAVFESASFEAQCATFRERLTRHSASSLRFAKQAYRLAQADDFDERLAAVERLYLEELMKTEDAAEGLAAFMEKRRAVWRNR
jgi:cyclohexa-1,5-dienecarbonyl-CoA hydratase